VVYLVAPQAWAWRAGRVTAMRRDLRKLLCIFPFEEQWFRQRGVDATYVGHPLAHLIQPTATRDAFRARHGLCPAQPLVAVLPGSRPGVIARHAPAVTEAIARLEEQGAQCVIGLPSENTRRIFVNQTRSASIQEVVGETWNLLQAADVALSASGTVTMEAALLGTPMVTFYRVNSASWLAGKLLVRTPFYTMVNLIAEKKIVPELMQNEATGENLAREVSVLLNDAPRREAMRDALNEVARRLRTSHDPMEKSALIVEEILGIQNA
jgi:lipid-A-disaccharide synthase